MVHQPATGRPRTYCRDSHRQRAYEARRLGWRAGLGPGEAIVTTDALADLGDRVTVLEAALEDVAEDLRHGHSLQAYRAAFDHLHAAASGLVDHRLSVRALTPPRPEGAH
ncbi:MAG: hypothetical protein V3U50_02285 [Acidimicrobiia bacterium]